MNRKELINGYFFLSRLSGSRSKFEAKIKEFEALGGYLDERQKVVEYD